MNGSKASRGHPCLQDFILKIIKVEHKILEVKNTSIHKIRRRLGSQQPEIINEFKRGFKTHSKCIITY